MPSFFFFNAPRPAKAPNHPLPPSGVACSPTPRVLSESETDCIKEVTDDRVAASDSIWGPM
jgi:hypothetical protein